MKTYFYECEKFQLFRDQSMDWVTDEEYLLDVPEDILKEYEDAQKAIDAVQKKLYHLRKEQKGY